MAQNETRAKCGLPVEVRSTAGLGITKRIREEVIGMDKTIVFEAHAPDGHVYRVNEDGSCSGFPTGTFMVIGFVRRYVLCAAHVKR